MNPYVLTLLAGATTVAVVMATGLALAKRQQTLTVVDTIWGLGFVAVAWASAALGSGGSGPRLLTAALVTVWGLRLAVHLHRRNHGKGEDPRYAELAEKDGRSFAEVALKRVFIPQGVSMWLVATPLMVGVHNPSLGIVSVIGAAIWLLGFTFESVGDHQLARFKADPAQRGTVMDQGLWRYTRHPNYFGDACVWTGLWLVVATTWPGVATVVSPMAMTFFLTKVTGAALAERRMKENKPGYADYMARTSGFIPLPPRTK